jgi:hypothetical protein
MAVPTKEITVVGPAGGTWIALTDDEQRFFEDLCRKYTEDYAFQNVSDLADLERIIQGEVLSQRYNRYLSTGEDYWGDTITVKEYEDALKSKSGELRQLKKALGIDRISRQKDSSDSLSDYIAKLLERAREFGVMRNDQTTAALTTFMELRSLVTLHDNSNEEERRTQGCTMEDIFDWLREYAFPEFDQVDREFVESSQRYWIQEM